MSLDTCFDALRFLSRSSELEATRLMTAELRINELLEQVKLVKREAEIGPQGAASFWQAISETLLRDRQRLAMIDGSVVA